MTGEGLRIDRQTDANLRRNVLWRECNQNRCRSAGFGFG